MPQTVCEITTNNQKLAYEVVSQALADNCMINSKQLYYGMFFFVKIGHSDFVGRSALVRSIQQKTDTFLGKVQRSKSFQLTKKNPATLHHRTVGTWRVRGGRIKGAPQILVAKKQNLFLQITYFCLAPHPIFSPSDGSGLMI